MVERRGGVSVTIAWPQTSSTVGGLSISTPTPSDPRGLLPGRLRLCRRRRRLCRRSGCYCSLLLPPLLLPLPLQLLLLMTGGHDGATTQPAILGPLRDRSKVIRGSAIVLPTEAACVFERACLPPRELVPRLSGGAARWPTVAAGPAAPAPASFRASALAPSLCVDREDTGLQYA